MEQASQLANNETQTTSQQEILISSLSAVKQSYKELTISRYPAHLTDQVKDFSIGLKFTVFHLYNNDMIFLKNEEFLNSQVNLDKINTRNIKKNVSKFSAASNDLFYLSTLGQLHVIFNSADLPSDQLTETVLETDGQLTDFNISYPRAVLLFQNTEKNEQVIKCLDMTNLLPTDLSLPTRLKNIQGLENQTVTSFCLGASYSYFLTTQGQVFECNFNTIENNEYKALPYESLKNKTIRKLWCGKGTFFALEQSEKSSIDNWTRQEILEWVQNKDFNEFFNIIKSEGITGRDLINADRIFLVDRLGMKKQDLQTKFLNEIQRLSKITYGTPKLFGWGNNSCGQLGLTMGPANINSPMEIKTLSELGKDGSIEHIECGTKATAIVTNKGRLWITEIPQKKDSKEKSLTTWLDLTSLCPQVKVTKISLNKDHLAMLVSSNGQKNTVSKEEDDQESTSMKLKGADHICDRLLWDKSLNKDEYVVGYEDRFLGILEIPFNDFCSKTDIPSHRIKYFKRNDEIVWDRVTKLNNIGL